ncbi:MAG TPA: LuxR C-terminal-related transcriptional regulator [Acidimicrobiales bacterium]|nr:LuxR C-terminal-related transcriptional regulator [Acidimicrobiales bacterium]
MALSGRSELVDALDAQPVAGVLADLGTHQVIAVNEKAAALFGASASALQGSDVAALVEASQRQACATAFDALAAKAIDGYVVNRELVRADGVPVDVSIWGRRVETDDGAYALFLYIEMPPGDLSALRSPFLLLVTDHEWRVDYISVDSALLGQDPDKLHGFPLLGLVHPSVANEFIVAASKVSSTHVRVTLHTRLRSTGGEFVDRNALIARMCEHPVPRLGVVITEFTSPNREVKSQLDHLAERSLLEAAAAHALQAPPLRAFIGAHGGLSARQAEIVARLIAGERVPDIARTMFLSASTIRNHLTAIYRKFAVHSQSELLAALLREERSNM